MKTDTHNLKLIPQPVLYPLGLISHLLMWIDRCLRKPAIKPFAIGFIVTSVVGTLAAYSLSPWYELVVNQSNSLPGTLYVLDKTRAPVCGDITVLDMPTDGRFYRGSRMIKKVRGCAGDMVSRKGRKLFINGLRVGYAMQTSTDGKYALYAASATTIPPNKVYLSASHPQSYDSRYASYGLRDITELLGTAYPIF